MFFGSFFGRYFQDLTMNDGFASGELIVKKSLPYLNKKRELPLYEASSNFYEIPIGIKTKLPIAVKKNRNDSNDNMKLRKEANFVLDCISKNGSKLSIYNSFQDVSLINFFNSGPNRKHLKQKGFSNLLLSE